MKDPNQEFFDEVYLAIAKAMAAGLEPQPLVGTLEELKHRLLYMLCERSKSKRARL